MAKLNLTIDDGTAPKGGFIGRFFMFIWWCLVAVAVGFVLLMMIFSAEYNADLGLYDSRLIDEIRRSER